MDKSTPIKRYNFFGDYFDKQSTQKTVYLAVSLLLNYWLLENTIRILLAKGLKRNNLSRINEFIWHHTQKVVYIVFDI